MKSILKLVIISLVLTGAGTAQTKQKHQQRPELERSSKRDSNRTTAWLVDEIRHELVTLPFYDVFDWLEGEVRPDATVILRGYVTRPTTKSDAEARIEEIESVSKVVNQIEVAPVSQSDNQIRRQVYRALFNFDSPLFMYALRAVPPIHILVKNGRVTLKGIVGNDMDRQLAETYARGVPDVFEVKNELSVENKQTSRRL
jgi:hyperosmotically inducible protein